MTGLTHATGEYVFLIDVDLEEEPELLGRFWQELHSSKDIDVVYGVQKSRKGKWFEKISGKIFWSLLNTLSDIDIPKNMITARLTTKRYNQKLVRYKESELFIDGIWIDTGFNQKPIYVKKLSSSETTYTTRKKIALLINSITSFSSKPLIYIFNTGFVITFFSLLFILKLIFNKLLFDTAFEGWTSLIVSVWFFGGLIIMFLGVIGIYISKIFTETKNRPFSIIKEIYGEEK